MRTSETPQKRIISLITELLIVILMINLSGSVYNVTERSSFFNYLLIVVTLVMIIYIISKRKIIIIQRKETFLIVFIFAIVLSFLLNYNINYLNMQISYIFMIIFSYLLSQIVTLKVFVKKFIFYMLILSISSVIFTTIISYSTISFNFPIIVTSNNRVFYDGIFYFYPQYYSTLRNQSVFWEPGLFSSYIIIALLIEVLYLKKLNLIHILIFSITIITTLSTAGIILLLFSYTIIISSKLTYKKSIMFTVFSILTILLTIFFWREIYSILINISPEVFSKLSFDNVSFSTRVFSLKENFNIFLQKPIFGLGVGAANEYYVNSAEMLNIDAQTATSSFFMASLGIFGVGYTAVWVINIFANKTFRILTKILFISIILIIINKEPHQSLLFMWVLLFYLFNKDFEQVQKKC